MLSRETSLLAFTQAELGGGVLAANEESPCAPGWLSAQCPVPTH